MVKLIRPKVEHKRRLSKTVKVSVSLPEAMVEFIDEIAGASEVSRSEVIQWVFIGIMEDDDLAELFFGESELEEAGEPEPEPEEEEAEEEEEEEEPEPEPEEEEEEEEEEED